MGRSFHSRKLQSLFLAEQPASADWLRSSPADGRQLFAYFLKGDRCILLALELIVARGAWLRNKKTTFRERGERLMRIRGLVL